MAPIGSKIPVGFIPFPLRISRTDPSHQAKLSPDAYIQMALQLAWYRTRNSFTATYETVLTRMFKRGRTETLRSYTNDSRTWILAMSDSHLPVCRFHPMACAIVTIVTGTTTVRAPQESSFHTYQPHSSSSHRPRD